MWCKLARRTLAGLAIVGISSVVGCAQERAPINRVQANALEKAFFVGNIADPSDDPEFYMRVTVTDVDSGAGSDGLFTNSDAQPTMRIRWEITQDLLIARLTYERIEDTDHKGVRRTPDGQAVAAYAIKSHFDIKRDYNEDTGEELNVVVENDEDRPWYQRAFFRVDWSKNLVTTAYELDTLSQLGIYYGVTWEDIAYYVNDPAHPDTPLFDAKRGYFDVTHKAWAKPQVIHDPDWGDFPACWLYGSFPSVNCNPSEVTLRISFLKVTDTDYEPLEYDGTKMDMFGLFTSDRFGYDRSYGVVDNRWHRFGTRWNLWQRSHAEPAVLCNTPDTTPVDADPHRDDDADGTEDECAAVGRGSRCDAVVGKCTLPLRDRKLRTIAWHVNPGFPEELFESTRTGVEAWSNAMRVAVLAGRMAECRRTGEKDCEQTLGWPARWSDDFVPPLGDASAAEVPALWQLCHNPVSADKGDDLAVCGKEGTAPRIGDLRYNIIAVVQDPQVMSPWGIMMDAEDPLTGEKVAGAVTEWGAVLDHAAATLADLVGLINGEIDPTSYIQGQNVTDWVAANQPGGTAERGKPMGSAELASRRAAFDPKVLEPILAGMPKVKAGAHPLAHRAARAKYLMDSQALGPGNTALTARLGSLRGSAIEASLVSPEMAQAAGYDPSAVPSSATIASASPFGRRMNPTLRRADRRARLLGNARRHACRYDAVDPDNLLGLAHMVLKQFPSPDVKDKAAVNEHRKNVIDWARKQFNQGVLAHELGHSVGLRHNFAASFDSLNYAPEYWQLRTGDGKVETPCADGTTDGAKCIGPRWRDPISASEIDGNINQYATTSVMDYPGEQSQDMLLPGKYDRAATRFTYGGVVDVFSEEGVTVKKPGAGQAKAYQLSAFATSPGLFGVNYFPPVKPADPYEFIHYSQYQSRFGLISECSADSSAALGTALQAELDARRRRLPRHAGLRQRSGLRRPSPGRWHPARWTRVGACVAATCSRATSTPTPATCPRSAWTRAPMPTSRCASWSKATRTATSWTRSAATGSSSTPTTSPHAFRIATWTRSRTSPRRSRSARCSTAIPPSPAQIS